MWEISLSVQVRMVRSESHPNLTDQEAFGGPAQEILWLFSCFCFLFLFLRDCEKQNKNAFLLICDQCVFTKKIKIKNTGIFHSRSFLLDTTHVLYLQVK